MLRTIGQKGIDLIVSFEKEVLHVYDDGYGYPTLGVGHLLTEAEKKAMPIGTPITREQSREYFKNDLKKYIDAVNEAIIKPCTQNEFDAMVSLCFNIGIGAFKGSSVVRKFNAGDKDVAANAFLSWNKAKGKVSKGLVRRRNVERTLFLSSAAPTTQPTNKVEQPEEQAGVIPQLPPIQNAVTQPVEVKIERVSVWGKIAAGFAAITGLGINLGTAIENKLNAITPEQLLYVLGGLALIGLALWIYDRMQSRAHAKTLAKIATAADPAKNTVDLTR